VEVQIARHEERVSIEVDSSHDRYPECSIGLD
jgi:hypothetical protein